MKWWVEECVGSFCGVRFVWNIFSSYCCQWSDSEPGQSHTDTHRSSDHDTVLILTTAQCHPVWGGAAMRLSSDENTGNSLESCCRHCLKAAAPDHWVSRAESECRVSGLHSTLIFSALPVLSVNQWQQPTLCSSHHTSSPAWPVTSETRVARVMEQMRQPGLVPPQLYPRPGR